uniref:Uncharacterized protein n=1 Tax=Bursaphelenchus xylophilus TaxID=6326 RepID=A0A1I7RJT3_BURXY
MRLFIITAFLLISSHASDDFFSSYISFLESYNVLILKKSAPRCPPRVAANRTECGRPTLTKFYSCAGRFDEICRENRQAYDIILSNLLLLFFITSIVFCLLCILLCACKCNERIEGPF